MANHYGKFTEEMRQWLRMVVTHQSQEDILLKIFGLDPATATKADINRCKNNYISR